MGIRKRVVSCASSVGALFFVGACAHPWAAWSDDVFAPTPTTPKAALDNDTAHILVEEHVVRFGEDEGVVVAREFTRTKTRIQGAAGQDRRGAGLSYSSTFSRVERLEAQTTAPDGTVRRYGADPKDVSDTPSLGTYMLYSDSRVRQLSIPEQPRGAVVEVAVVERMTRPDLFAFNHGFGDTIPVDMSRFVVEAPSGWVVEIATRSGGAASTWAPTTTEDNGVQRFVWQREALAPLPQAALAPALWQRVDVVAVRLKKAVLKSGVVVGGPADDVALSRTTAEMAEGQAQVTPELEKIVVDVLGADWAKKPKRERAAKLYGWTRDSIRYCAIEIGLGGWIPHPSVDTERLRYGDCKDKANLLKALLQVVDVKSNLVTIYSGYWPRPFVLPVVGGNFNHAILQVELDDGPVIVDPTTRTVAFADLPPNDEERQCLPATLSGSPLVMTAASSPATDKRVTTWKLRAVDGFVVGTVNSELHGHFSDRLRDQLLEASAKDRPKVVADVIGGEAFALSTVAVENEAAPIEVTPARVTAEVKLPLHDRQKKLFNIISAGSFLDDAEPVFDGDRPAVPARLWARDKRLDTLEYELPAGWGVEHLPPAFKHEGPAVAYELRWSVAGSTLSLHREVTHRVVDIDVAGLDDFAKGLAGYHRAMEARVMLTRPAQETP